MLARGMTHTAPAAVPGRRRGPRRTRALVEGVALTARIGGLARPTGVKPILAPPPEARPRARRATRAGLLAITMGCALALAAACASAGPVAPSVWAGGEAPAPTPDLDARALLVLPFQVLGDDLGDALGVGLAALLSHQSALHPGLDVSDPHRDWPAVLGVSTEEGLDPGLASWLRAPLDAPPAIAASRARWVLAGRLAPGSPPTLHLRLLDREAGATWDASSPLDLPGALRPRFALLRLFDAAGLAPSPALRGAMIWTEELDHAAFARVDDALRGRPAVPPPESWSYLVTVELGRAFVRDPQVLPRRDRVRAQLDRALLLNPLGVLAAAELTDVGAQGADRLLELLRSDACRIGGKGLMGLIGVRGIVGTGVVTGIGGVYAETGCAPPHDMVEPLERSFRATRGDLERAALLGELGLARQHAGDLDGARADLAALVELRTALGWAAAIVEARIRLGDVELARSDHAAAEETLVEAARIARLADHPHLVARALNSLGLVHRAAGAYDRAVTTLEDAAALFEGLGDDGNTGVALGNLGSTRALVGQYDEAVAILTRAVALKRGTSLPGGVAVLLSSLGAAHRAAGRIDAAREALEEAIGLAEGASTRAMLLSNLADLDLEAGDAARALARLEEAAALAREARDATLAGLIRHNQGELALRAGRLEEATEVLEDALVLRRQVGDRAGEGLTLTSLMATWARRGDPELAIFFGKLGVQALQDVRASAAAIDEEAARAFVGARAPIYRALAEILFEAGRLAEAEEVLALVKLDELERFTRGEVALEAMSLTLSPGERAGEERYREVADRVMSVAREYAALTRKWPRTPSEERRLDALAADLEVANARFAREVAALRAALDGSRGAGHVDTILGIGADLAELPAGTVAVFTLVGESALRVFLVSAEGRVARTVPVEVAALGRLVETLRGLLQDPRTDPRRTARRLYDLLIAPIEADLEGAGARTIMWSLDGPLRYVPIAALHDGERWAAERWRHTIITPASLARLKDRPRHPWQALAAGVSQGHPGFVALPAVVAELAQIVADPEGSGTGVLPGRALLDESFTLDRFVRELRSPIWQVVHVASHFTLRAGDAEASHLLLGDGGALSVARLQALPDLFRGVDLLALSACDTGAVGRGEEIESFAVLAQRKGARAVIATLWPVADGSTGLFFRRFYGAHRGQPAMSKAEALRLAQLDLMHRGGERGEDYAHPFYWAPFILIGNWL